MTNVAAATASRARSVTESGSSTSAPATRVAMITSDDAGSRRRARLAQKRPRPMEPVRSSSPRSSDVIRKPETTKNTSTPM